MHFPRRPAILSSRAAKPTPSWSAAVTSGAWPSGPLQFLPVPAIKKSPRIAVFKRFSGGFPVQPGRCPPRRAAADVRPPAAPGHKKRRRPPSTPSRSMNVRMCGPFPPEICPFPLKNGGFPALPPVLPVYPGFSIILSPYSRAVFGICVQSILLREFPFLEALTCLPQGPP